MRNVGQSWLCMWMSIWFHWLQLFKYHIKKIRKFEGKNKLLLENRTNFPFEKLFAILTSGWVWPWGRTGWACLPPPASSCWESRRRRTCALSPCAPPPSPGWSCWCSPSRSPTPAQVIKVTVTQVNKENKKLEKNIVSELACSQSRPRSILIA